MGLPAEEYRAEITLEHLRLDRNGRARGRRRLVDELYAPAPSNCRKPRELPCHTGLVLLSERGRRLAA